MQHTTGGYMVFAATTCKYVFNMKPRDVHWCTADCGWIMGHTVVTYGPLLNGAATLLFEGVPTYPHYGRVWEIVEKWRVQYFFTAPTLIRSLMSHGDKHVTKYDRSSLQVRAYLHAQLAAALLPSMAFGRAKRTAMLHCRMVLPQLTTLTLPASVDTALHRQDFLHLS
jgi:AMP-binding enzyme